MASVRNIKLTIEYKGTGYEGWQVQNPAKSSRFPVREAKTVQAVIESALQPILNEKVKLTGSGRTDAGVHARAQVANFHTSSAIPSGRLRRALNGALPRDISISKAEDVPEGFHSRFSAKWKLYRYTVLNRAYPSALANDFVYFCDYALDITAMRREARALKGTHDFRSFHAAGDGERSSVRTIRRLTIARKGDEIAITIEASGFLKNMVRTIAGTLIEVGRGRFSRGSMKRILDARDRKSAGPTAPPQGLCLLKVTY